MQSRERTTRTIRRQKTDRMPLYGWVSENMSEQISEAFGSVAAFEDHYEFDLAHLFGGPQPMELQGTEELEPSDLLELSMTDPDDPAPYADLIAQIDHHRQRDRFLYVQTPGILEQYNTYFGIENHLMYLLLYPELMHEIYARQVIWTRRFLNNCLDLGIDMIHVSDDWGSQQSLLISPDHWRSMIFPYHKQITSAVAERGAFASLHSDGNITSVLDGIRELGYDVIHPFQESAGMSYAQYQQHYAQDFILMGGIDIQTTLGFGKIDLLKREIERVVDTFRNGGLILCTSHFVQDHCTIEELITAYDTAYALIRA